MRGVKCFCDVFRQVHKGGVSVPLRGVDWFQGNRVERHGHCVSVPLRGVSASDRHDRQAADQQVSVPLRGVGCFGAPSRNRQKARVSVPLRGVGCFKVDHGQDYTSLAFPSPCGVWVVSAKLHILFGAIGKRIVNSAVLLYHIGRWFINSKLRNCKVPCEAHKTAT